MRWTLAAVILASVLWAKIGLAAEERTIGALVADCRWAVERDRADYSSGRCMGYIGATADMGFILEYVDKATPFCIPNGASFKQLVAVFVRWADAHPERWHEPMVMGPMDAFREAFPCKK